MDFPPFRRKSLPSTQDRTSTLCYGLHPFSSLQGYSSVCSKTSHWLHCLTEWSWTVQQSSLFKCDLTISPDPSFLHGHHGVPTLIRSLTFLPHLPSSYIHPRNKYLWTISHVPGNWLFTSLITVDFLMSSYYMLMALFIILLNFKTAMKTVKLTEVNSLKPLSSIFFFFTTIHSKEIYLLPRFNVYIWVYICVYIFTFSIHTYTVCLIKKFLPWLCAMISDILYIYFQLKNPCLRDSLKTDC